MTVAILFISFVVFIVASVPIGVALASASLLTIFLFDPVSGESFMQFTMSGLNSFPLIAVPLFTFAGDLMGRGGISKRLLKVVSIFFGRFTGGFGMVSIVACMFFAAISGTGSATVAAIGGLMIPNMVAKGYKKEYSSALVASAGTIGVIIPPSVVMVVYAVSAEASVTAMFTAGIVPGILIGLALCLYNYFQSKAKKYVGDSKRYTLKEKISILVEAVPALMIPVIILGGIYGGFFTPTESAAVGVVYGFIVAKFVYKEIRFRDIPKISFNSLLICSTVLIIIGISTGFGRILTITQAPVMIAEMILDVTSNKILILLLINVLLLIVGTFMETNASIIILTPILLPVVRVLGVSTIHFGLIMIANLSIGFITPPLGANLFMACQITNVKFDDISKAIIPWIVVLIIVLMLITYIPEISLFLPKLMGMNVE